MKSNHAKEECWYPNKHVDYFSDESAALVFDHIVRVRRFFVPKRMTTMCEFGGAQYHNMFLDIEEARGGTWACCPKCKMVHWCGFNDETGVQPKVCGCGKKLTNSDYFQAVADYCAKDEKRLHELKLFSINQRGAIRNKILSVLDGLNKKDFEVSFDHLEDSVMVEMLPVFKKSNLNKLKEIISEQIRCFVHDDLILVGLRWNLVLNK